LFGRLYLVLIIRISNTKSLMSSLNYKYAWRSVAKKTKTIEKKWLKKLNPKKKKKLRKPIKKTSATLNTLPDRLFSLAISHSGLPSSLMEVATSPLHLRLLSLRCVPSLYIYQSQCLDRSLECSPTSDLISMHVYFYFVLDSSVVTGIHGSDSPGNSFL
jgi:hypothetical protein